MSGVIPRGGSQGVEAVPSGKGHEKPGPANSWIVVGYPWFLYLHCRRFVREGLDLLEVVGHCWTKLTASPVQMVFAASFAHVRKIGLKTKIFASCKLCFSHVQLFSADAEHEVCKICRTCKDLPIARDWYGMNAHGCCAKSVAGHLLAPQQWTGHGGLSYPEGGRQRALSSSGWDKQVVYHFYLCLFDSELEIYNNQR